MCLFKKEKISSVWVGLIQSGIVVIYCSLVSALFKFLSVGNNIPDVFWGPLLMLTLLVFSAAVMGLTVFGYAVLLAFDKKTKEAIKVLLWTFLFLIIFGTCLVLLLFLL